MQSNLDNAKLARIDERTANTSRLLEAHIDEDNKKFERVFGYLKERFDKVEGHFDRVEKKMESLWDERNHARGAYTASRILIVCAWTVLIAGATFSISVLAK